VHFALGRNSLAYVTWKDRKAMAADLKAIYRTVSEEQARATWTILPASGTLNNPRLVRPGPVTGSVSSFRKVIYTTNAIESLNSVIRKAIRNRKIFPHDASALRVVSLATHRASQIYSIAYGNSSENVH